MKDFSKMDEIIKWSTSELQNLNITDQLLIVTAFCELIEKIEPIYEKYTKQNKKEDNVTYLLNLLMQNNEDKDNNDK